MILTLFCKDISAPLVNRISIIGRWPPIVAIISAEYPVYIVVVVVVVVVVIVVVLAATVEYKY